MGFGVGLALIGVGAVLAFAVRWDVPGIDLQMIGWIFMAIGAASLTLTAVFTRRREPEEVETVEPERLYTREEPRPAEHEPPPSGYREEEPRTPPRAYYDNG